MTPAKTPTIIIILDGFGYSKEYATSAITPKTMPFFFSLLHHYPWTTLLASGTAVGLPDGVPGNSAVGHFTLGAGKIIEQPLTQFSRMIHEDTLRDVPVIKNNFTRLAQSGATLHLVGLVSDGGSHSKLEHTQALITLAGIYGIKRIIIHAILDGRDAPQKSARGFLERIEKTIHTLPPTTHAEIGTLQGRLYAMDRNENKVRLLQAYDILTRETAHTPATWHQVIEKYYTQGLYDEIIPPTQITSDPTVKSGDGLIFVNIRADRCRELYDLFKKNTHLLFLISGISYDSNPDELTICTTPTAHDTLKDYLKAQDITLFSVAESEKYAHITYFFNGGRQETLPGETRVIIPSDSPKNFVHEPAMKAAEITHVLVTALKQYSAECYLVNYANADMVGHSGNLEATRKAATVLDNELRILYQECVVNQQGILLVTGDHGNAEDKSHHNPAHTNNPVYFLAVSNPPISQQILATMKTLADVKEVIIKIIKSRGS